MLFIYLRTVNGLHVLLFNISNPIYQLFPCNINNLHTTVWFQITNYHNIPT